MNDFIYTESDFETRPIDGYTYIYIYSLDNLYLYVGQTIQSIEGRYKNHLSDNSGAHYANNIAYFQIKSKYANYAEGYIAERVRGICQGGVPNPAYHRDTVPKDTQKTLQKIGNKLANRKDGDKTLKTGCLPLFSIIIDNDSSQKETLAFFSMILKENTIVEQHYHKKNKEYIFADQNELYIKKMDFINNIEGYLLSRPKSDYRPILFMKADTIAKIRFIRNIISNFPVYCVVDKDLYCNYKDTIKNLFKHNQTGLMVQYLYSIETIYDFPEDFRAFYKAKLKNGKYMECETKEIIPFCATGTYKAKRTPYCYYQCA